MPLDCQLSENGERPTRERSKFGGCSEQLEIARVEKQQQTGQIHVIAIYLYPYYVFVVRVCVLMVRMDSGRLGDSAKGIAYLVIYHTLFIMFV
ncbi:hypothetical protein MNV49_003030 [Pseudohyphozyma bogoriensis]|nr:hypothetical protein MNV49_003030 [Pseudohyphozyma bogoriensis]